MGKVNNNGLVVTLTGIPNLAFTAFLLCFREGSFPTILPYLATGAVQAQGKVWQDVVSYLVSAKKKDNAIKKSG